MEGGTEEGWKGERGYNQYKDVSGIGKEEDMEKRGIRSNMKRNKHDYRVKKGGIRTTHHIERKGRLF